MSQTIWLVQPESFVTGDFLPESLSPYADDARYFMSLLLWKLSHRQVDRHGLVRLKAEYLRSVMHFHRYSDIVEALVAGGAVERFPYAVGKQSFGYRLGRRFIGDKHMVIPARDRRLIERIRAAWAEAEGRKLARMKPVHHELARRQAQLQIDLPAAQQILDSLPVKSNKFDVQGVLVANIAQGEHHFSVGGTGRVANSITSLSRKLRPTLMVNHEPLASVDLTCAQAALLANLIEKSSKSTAAGGQGCTSYMHSLCVPPFLPDLSCLSPSSLFSELAQNGSLYEFLQQRLAEAGVQISRDCVKKRVLCDVFAKRKANAAGAESQPGRRHLPTALPG